MFEYVLKWLRGHYERIVNSIAFYPALIAIGFLLFSWLMLKLDLSEEGKEIKAYVSWIRLRDASTALSIVSTIAAGIISLTVFSFSMVMIVLNQAASQMSNRMLEGMISNRFQQVVLGIYIGIVVYALFLLTSIRNIDSGVYVPALSIYFLLLLTVLAIFLFIYFLHYVTQSVKFETIIERVHKKTMHYLNKACTKLHAENFIIPSSDPQIIYVSSSGYYQGFDKKQLIEFACRHSGIIQFIHPKGTYLLKGESLLIFYSYTKLFEKETNDLLDLVNFYNGHPIEETPYYGFHQLAEVAIKALSPAINDPETAVLSIHALSDLFLFRIHNYITDAFTDDELTVRIHTTEWGFEDLFRECFYPIWNYGKKDRYIQKALKEMAQGLILADTQLKYTGFVTDFLDAIKKQIISS
ncbi:MAG: DUF2254 domain-containing protein [Bacteroidota bacterium]|nr:DUF2254 domain-containing protein [Bacteroidota bacterium]